MDIIQEHIDLLRAQFDILQRMHGPVRRYRAGRNCQKGYNCGGSCITRKKNCRKALEGEAKNFSEWMVSKMSAGIPAVVGEKPVANPSEWRQWGIKDVGKKDGSGFATEEQAKRSSQYKEAKDPTIVKRGDGYKIRTGQPMTEDQARIVLDQAQSVIGQAGYPNPFMGKKEKPLSVRDPELFEMKQQAEEVLGEGRFRWKKMDEYNPQLQAQYGISEAKFNQLRKDAGLPVKSKSKDRQPMKASVPKELQQEIKKKGAGFKFLEQDYLSGVEGKAIAEDALKKAKTPEEKRAAQQELDRYADVAKNGATLTERMPLAMQRALKAAGASGFTKVKNPRPGDKDPARTKDILLNQWRRDGLIADPFNEAR